MNQTDRIRYEEMIKDLSSQNENLNMILQKRPVQVERTVKVSGKGFIFH